MYIIVSSLVAGLLAAHVLWSVWPPVAGTGLAVAAGLLLLRRPRSACCLLAFVTGICITAATISSYLQSRIGPELRGATVMVEGRIGELPRHSARSVRFLLLVDHASTGMPRRILVTWFSPELPPRAGEYWRLPLRLQPPAAARNPTADGLDLERWYSAHRIQALAQVHDHGAALRLEPGRGLQAVRERVSARLQHLISDERAAGMAAALLVGDRRLLTSEQWRMLLDTGTNHLVAISGLHISLAAGGVWLLAAWGWAAASPWCNRIPSRLAGAAPALVVATGYAALAGFALPTQRALLMLVVFTAAICSRRNVDPFLVLLLAALLVLLRDPLAPLQAGFWLSFLAVGVLLAIAAGVVGGFARGWRGWTYAQVALFAGLAPITAVVFGHVPIISPIANSIAVPAVGLMIVPLLLSSLPLLVIWKAAGEFLIGWAGWMLLTLDQVLAWLDGMAPVLRQNNTAPPWLGALLFVLVLCWLRGMAGRMMLVPVLALSLTVFGWRPATPQSGEARIIVYDAGYGHATLVRTRNHSLLVDTGPRGFSSTLHRSLLGQGATPLGRLLVSRDRAGHHANGHRWPAAGSAYGHRAGRPCGDAGAWEWDAVRFVAVPLANSGNCIVLVRAADQTLVIATGVEHAAQWAALRGEVARGAVLVAAGHGHRDLLPPPWLRPATVIIPVDSGRRYGLPHQETAEELARTNARVYATGCHGAVEVHLGTDREPAAMREQSAWWDGSQPFGRNGKSYIIPSVCEQR